MDTACCFEGFERELAELERRYVPPEGLLLVAYDGGVPVGCAGLRRLEDGTAEARRLYVRDTARGRGLGGALVLRLVAEARAAGFSVLRLETLPGKMVAAVALYRALGFEETAPYVKRPIAGALYLALPLGAGAAPAAI